MPWFAAAQAPQQTCARGTDHPPFIGEETEVQKGHVTPLGSRSMGGGARLGLGTASAPPTDQVQSSLPSFTLLHPLTQRLPGSHYLTLKTHFPSWNLSSWEVMLPGNLVLNCLAKAAVKGLSSVKSHQKSHLGDANQMVERTVSHVHSAGGELPRSPQDLQPSKTRDPTSRDATVYRKSQVG